MPCVKRPANGSSISIYPHCFSARMKKREYSRCKTACSTPPIYWSTGIQYSAAARSNGTGARAEQKRRKYQDESMNVSKVSVSRVAGPLHVGQARCFQVG